MVVLIDKSKAMKILTADMADFNLAKDKRVVLLQLLEKHKSFYDIVKDYGMDPKGVEQVVAALLEAGDYDLRKKDEAKLYDFFREDQVIDSTVFSFYPIVQRVTEAELAIMIEEELGKDKNWFDIKHLNTADRHKFLKFRADLTRAGIHVNNDNGRYSLYDAFKLPNLPAVSSHNNSVIVIGG